MLLKPHWMDDSSDGAFLDQEGNYVFMRKHKLPIDDAHVVCFLCFKDGSMPEVYIIPSTAWNTTNAVFVDRNYDKPGHMSKPE